MTAADIISCPSMFNGCRLLSDPYMTETKTTPIERNWFMKIVAKVFKLRKFHVETVPSRKIYCVHDSIIAHPALIAEIEQAIKAQEKPCQLLR